MSQDPKSTASPDSPDEMSRRQFFGEVGVGSVAVAPGHCRFSDEFLSPNVLYEPSPIVDDVGKPNQYAPGLGYADRIR